MIRWCFPADWQAETEKIPVTDTRMARCFPGSLWRLCLTAPAAKDPEAEWIIKMKD